MRYNGTAEAISRNEYSLDVCNVNTRRTLSLRAEINQNNTGVKDSEWKINPSPRTRPLVIYAGNFPGGYESNLQFFSLHTRN